MNDIVVFSMEVLISLLVSAFIVVRLQGLLKRIGTEACPRGAMTAEFWVTYTQLMMFIAPLILIAFISRAGELSAVAQMKSSLLVVLLGQFTGLVLVGRAVWRSIIVPAREEALLTAVETQAAAARS